MEQNENAVDLFVLSRPIYERDEDGHWRKTTLTQRYPIQYWGDDPEEAYYNFLADYNRDILRFSIDIIPFVIHSRYYSHAECSFTGRGIRRTIMAKIDRLEMPPETRDDWNQVRKHVAIRLAGGVLASCEEDLDYVLRGADKDAPTHSATG